jgi:zinc protease
MRSTRAAARSAALSALMGAASPTALEACAPSPPPLHVPGPTTSHPEALKVTEAELHPLPIVARRDPASGVVAFRIVFGSGSADDPPGKEGLTRLTATTMTEGGTLVRSYAELVEKLYPMAVSIQVRVDRDETVFYADVAADAVEAFYPFLKEVLLVPRLDDAGVDRMRTRAKSELVDELRGSNDEALGKEALAFAIYEGHPYGHPAVGTESGLLASTAEEVRGHRARVFCKDRVVLGVAGGFPEGFDERLAKDFQALPACAAARAELPEPAAVLVPRLLLVDKSTAESTAISIGMPADFTRASPDFAAMTLFTDYLGLHRQPAGRLFHELRERRGLNYGDYAYAEYFEQDGGTRFALPNLVRRQQMVSLWLRPVRPKNAGFALRAALYVYRETLERGVPESELQRFRGFMTRYTSLEELTETRRLGNLLDDLAYGASQPLLASLREGWNRTDPLSLSAIVDRHLRGKAFVIAIVAKDASALAAELALGGPTPPVYDAPKPPLVLKEDREISRLALGLSKDRIRIVQYTDLFK